MLDTYVSRCINYPQYIKDKINTPRINKTYRPVYINGQYVDMNNTLNVLQANKGIKASNVGIEDKYLHT